MIPKAGVGPREGPLGHKAVVITCPHCARVLDLPQKYPYHAGLSSVAALYCDLCSTTLVFSSYNAGFISLLDEAKHPWTVSDDEKERIEAHLVPCLCGGQFRFDLPPRCPSCSGSLTALLPDSMSYLVIGNHVDGETCDIWLKR